MLEIYVVRHGQDKDNEEGILNGHRDEDLTDLGEQQAERLAQKIEDAGIQFDAVYTSPLVRARSTTSTICDWLGVNNGDPIILHSLIERDFGYMAGEKVSEIEKLCAPYTIKTGTITYFLSGPGVETFFQLWERARRVIQLLEHLHQGPNHKILLVTHGDMGKALYGAYYNIRWREVLNIFHFGNGELLRLAKGTTLEERHLFRQEQHNH